MKKMKNSHPHGPHVPPVPPVQSVDQVPELPDTNGKEQESVFSVRLNRSYLEDLLDGGHPLQHFFQPVIS